MTKLLFQCRNLLCPKTNFGPTITDELQYGLQRDEVTRVGVCHVASDISQIRTFDVGCRSRSSLFEPHLQPKDAFRKVRKRRAAPMRSRDFFVFAASQVLRFVVPILSAFGSQWLALSHAGDLA